MRAYAEGGNQQEEIPADGPAGVDEGPHGHPWEEPGVHGGEAEHEPAVIRQAAEERELQQRAALRDLQGARGHGREDTAADEAVTGSYMATGKEEVHERKRCQ